MACHGMVWNVWAWATTGQIAWGSQYKYLGIGRMGICGWGKQVGSGPVGCLVGLAKEMGSPHPSVNNTTTTIIPGCWVARTMLGWQAVGPVPPGKRLPGHKTGVMGSTTKVTVGVTTSTNTGNAAVGSQSGKYWHTIPGGRGFLPQPGPGCWKG